MSGSPLDATREDVNDHLTVARVTLAVGRLRLSTETRASREAALHLRAGRSPTADIDRDLGVRLPRFP